MSRNVTLVMLVLATAGLTAPVGAVEPRPSSGANQNTRLAFSTKRLANSSAELDTIREVLHSTVKLLPNDWIELGYDFSKPGQMEDFSAKSGEDGKPANPAAWQISSGSLKKITADNVPLFHRTRFNGPVTVTFKGTLINGNQCVAGYLDSQTGAQLLAGVSGEPLVPYLAESGKVLAESAKPLLGRIHSLVVSITDLGFSVATLGQPALAARRSDKPSSVGQIFFLAACRT